VVEQEDDRARALLAVAAGDPVVDKHFGRVLVLLKLVQFGLKSELYEHFNCVLWGRFLIGLPG
jgi:hypothetical protein